MKEKNKTKVIVREPELREYAPILWLILVVMIMAIIGKFLSWW